MKFSTSCEQQMIITLLITGKGLEVFTSFTITGGSFDEHFVVALAFQAL